MRLVITTFVTYLKAHWLQKLLLTHLIREIVTKSTENTEKKTFPRTFPLIKNAAPARITSISSASENSNDTCFSNYVTYLKAHWLQKLLRTPLIRKIVTTNTENTEEKTFSIAYFA